MKLSTLFTRKRGRFLVRSLPAFIAPALLSVGILVQIGHKKPPVKPGERFELTDGLFVCGIFFVTAGAAYATGLNNGVKEVREIIDEATRNTKRNK